MDFYRYNHDGYGETSTGGDFVSSGIGRLWPILDGEFGQYQDLLGNKVAPVRDRSRALRHAVLPDPGAGLEPRPAGR